MLQINTGKFFTTDKFHKTRHRAVLYSNYAPSYRSVDTPDGTSLSPVIYETPAGSFMSMSSSKASGEVFPWLYEVEEREEAVRPDGTREFMLSVGAEFFIHDFAAVVAFALNITCTPDLDLTRRLVHDQHGSLGVRHPPKQYVGRVFEPLINIQDGDGARLQEFIGDLVGLKRHAYNAAIRAIRRYVTGLHRIADDLDLAYALLVASIESLAQSFDSFTSTWEDFDQNKREALDKVLSKASPDVADDVRNVLLAHEHHALRRRYQEFTLQHLRPSFFREEAAGETAPVRRSDLSRALERAYVFRSKYVHKLMELPRYLTTSPSTIDSLRLEGEPVLTLHGLARVARHVIGEFIARSPKCEREVLDYREELPNRVRLKLAFSIWGTWSAQYDHKSARRYLGGFLMEDLTAALTSVPPKTVTIADIRGLAEKIESLVPGLAKAEQRLPMLTLYLLFHRLFPPEDHRPDFKRFFDKYADDFEAPSIESMLLHVLSGSEPEWTIEEFEETRRAYFKQRYTKNGLEMGATLEAAVTLFSAEIHRRRGHEDLARKLLSEAVENLPGKASLLELERRLFERPTPEINWRELLLPASPEATSDVSQASELNVDQETEKKSD
jgi:hypothetical protein